MTLPAPAIVTVGTFDGLHRGHLEVIATLEETAAGLGLAPLLITFANHPLDVVAPARAPKLLMTPKEKKEALRALPVRSEMLRFDRALCSLTARQWLERLRNEYGARAIVVGYDNTFGSDGRFLTRHQLRDIADDLGLKWVEPPVLEGISSSHIRRTVAAGLLPEATAMLGRPYTIHGRVVPGKQLGRRLGFPTANLAVDACKLLPAPGVYAADAELPDNTVRHAVLNIGSRPTVDDGNALSVEAHIIGYHGDLYGKTLTLNLLQRLRDERKFRNLDELQAAIAADVAAAAAAEAEAR